MVKRIFKAYGLQSDSVDIRPFGSGLINRTWKITAANKEYILQRINQSIFKNPNDIAENIRLIANILKLEYPQYKFVAPVTSLDGSEMVYEEGQGFFRLFPFVPNSFTVDVVETPEQAFEAATQFGRFTRLLRNADINKLNVTIPSFHDLSLRHTQFLTALENGNRERIKQSAQLIQTLLGYNDIVTEYERIKLSTQFKLRVTHHDTKISNVLFGEDGKGLCVIDLDTIMPGYFISDVGDMMRTYLSPVSEEERDVEKIVIRENIYHAIVQGYYNEMKDELTETEKKYFFYAAKFMIYMQAIRFLTDHLNDDIYYGAKYEGHNLVRATNQAVLLQRLVQKESVLVDHKMLAKEGLGL
ncbi:MAG: aminoglycoside phosphotransferase [Ferruginibacter sp.]|nr:aminoglycoside phosphotransferase [Ferruginibacter sp.]